MNNELNSNQVETEDQPFVQYETWKLGVKLQYVVLWSEQQRIPPNLTTTEVCERLIKPATERTQLSYCEQLLLSKDTAKFVGPPSAFISHAWRYNFLEVLEALTSYFATEEDVIIWFDLFSNNQHTAPSRDFEWWCNTFKNAITSFGRTVMVLAPWNDPLPLQRGWCIWELYCTISGRELDGKYRFFRDFEFSLRGRFPYEMPFGNFRCLSYLEFPSFFRENNCGRVEKTKILNLEKNDLQRSGPNNYVTTKNTIKISFHLGPIIFRLDWEICSK